MVLPPAPTPKLIGVHNVIDPYLKVASTPMIGIGLCDRFLTFARPLITILPRTFDNLLLTKLLDISKEEDVGAWVVGLPVLATCDIKKDAGHMKLRDELTTLLVKSSSLSIPPFCISKVPPCSMMYAQDVMRYHKVPWKIPVLSLYDLKTSDDERCAIHASIALQMWLKKHCYVPNLFGSRVPKQGYY